LFATGVYYTGGKFGAGVVDTGSKFANGIFGSTIECEKTEIKFILTALLSTRD
jgi:hypothetical protein